MKTSLLTSCASLLVLLALLLPTTPAAAADGAPGGRNRIIEHRPNYKKYKGKRTHSSSRLSRIFHIK